MVYESRIENILKKYKSNKLSHKACIKEIKKYLYEDIGFVKIDHHRVFRKGLPEVIFCEGKTVEQVTKIFKKLSQFHRSNILATRANEEIYKAVLKIEKNAKYDEPSKTISLIREKVIKTLKPVTIITAGTGDIPVAEEAAVTLECMRNPVAKIYDAGVAGIHRLIDHLEVINDSNVVIVIAGMEGALPSVLGGLIDKPIIAVPTSIGYGASFNGISALLTMLNSCSPGIVVVNINNGFGAGYFAGVINRKMK